MEKFKSNDAFDFTVGSRVKGAKIIQLDQFDQEKDCLDCTLLKQNLNECKKQVAILEKKNKFLIAQKNDLNKEVAILKENVKEMNKESENLGFLENIGKKDLEIKRLKDELKKTQGLFEEMTKEYESFSVNVSNIEHLDEMDLIVKEKDDIIREKDEIIKEKEKIIKEKDSALIRAQGIIKKLNEECEGHGQMMLEETKVQSNDELRLITKKYKDLKAKNFEECENFNLKIEQLTYEKELVENAFEELSQKFQEIEKITLQKMEDFSDNFRTINDLEEKLNKKEMILANQKKINQDLEITKQLEIETLKKSVKLAFEKIYQKEGDYSEKNNEKLQFKCKNLTQILKELLYCDSVLQRTLKGIIEREAYVIDDCVKAFEYKAEGFRAEFEKWVMRNEELEQRLVSVENNNLKLIRVIADLQKIIFVKDRQFDEVVKVYTGIGREMQSTIDFLSIELNDKQAMIVKDFLPSAYNLFRKATESSLVSIYRTRR